MGIEHVKAEIAKILEDRRDGSAYIYVDAAERMESLAEGGLQKIRDGQQILKTLLLGALPTHLQYLGDRIALADTSRERIEAVAVPKEGEAHLHIEAALTGTDIMANGYKAATETCETMRGHLAAALGHLGAFFDEMNAYADSDYLRRTEESTAMSGAIHTNTALEGYIAEA